MLNYKNTFFHLTADFEGNENCNCRSDTSESGLITIKCQLPKTINQTSQLTQGSFINIVLMQSTSL